jgi:hypothetical protein
MKQKTVLNISETALVALFRWEITPPEGCVLLFRTETDPSPQELIGPAGEGSIELVEPRTPAVVELQATRALFTLNVFRVQRDSNCSRRNLETHVLHWRINSDHHSTFSKL